MTTGEPNAPEVNGAPPRELQFWDAIVALWGVLTLLFLSGNWLPRVADKAAFLVLELTIIIAAILYVRWRRLPPANTFRWRGAPLRVIWGSALMAVGTAVLVDGLDRVVALFIPLPEADAAANREAFSASTGWDWIWLVLGVAVATPWVEESVFRGMVQQVLEKTRGVTSGVMWSALLFALVHMQFAWMFQLLVLAVLLGWTAWRWNSIIPGVMIHSAVNLLTLFLINRPTWFEGWYLAGTQVHPIPVAAALAAFVSGAKTIRAAEEKTGCQDEEGNGESD